MKSFWVRNYFSEQPSRRCSVKIVILNIFGNLTGKHEKI